MSLSLHQFRRSASVLTLLLVAVLTDPAGAQTCTSPVPATWTNRVETTVGTLHVTLATLQYDYSPGQSVAMKLHIQNIGASSVFVPNPSQVTPIEVFGIVPVACDSLYDPDCSLVYLFPGITFFFGAGFTLQPGQCREFDRTWNGLTGGPPAPPPDGVYSIIAGLQGPYDATTDGLFLPDGGQRLNIRITSGVPVLSSSWSRIKARLD